MAVDLCDMRPWLAHPIAIWCATHTLVLTVNCFYVAVKIHACCHSKKNTFVFHTIGVGTKGQGVPPIVFGVI